MIMQICIHYRLYHTLLQSRLLDKSYLNDADAELVRVLGKSDACLSRFGKLEYACPSDVSEVIGCARADVEAVLDAIVEHMCFVSDGERVGCRSVGG